LAGTKGLKQAKKEVEDAQKLLATLEKNWKESSADFKKLLKEANAVRDVLMEARGFIQKGLVDKNA